MNTKRKTFISIVVFLTLGLTAELAGAEVSFGTPVNLGPIVNSADDDGSPTISADGLELYFHSTRAGGAGDADIWVATRATKDDEWGKPVNLGPVVNSPASEVAPSISADGLSLYFCDWGIPRPGGFGETDLWVTKRATKDDPWEEPVNLGPTVNSSAHEVTPEISFNGLELYFEADFPGGVGTHDLWVTTRATLDDEWGEPINPGPMVNGTGWEHCPTISADGLTLFYDSQVLGGEGHAANDLMVTRRPTLDGKWTKAVSLGHAYSAHYASDLSADGVTLYFDSDHPGGSGENDIWQIQILSMDSSNEALKAIFEKMFTVSSSANINVDADAINPSMR